jgi:hypothetical protein
LISSVIIIGVPAIISPEDEMQFWSSIANSAGIKDKDEKEEGTTCWYGLERLVKYFRLLLCSFRI